MKGAAFHPAAEIEVEAAAAYYEAQKPGLGHEFRTEFESSLQRIVDNPLQYAVEIGRFRACPLHRFS